MIQTYHFNLVTRSVGRQISDQDWQKLEPLHIHAWKTANRRLNGLSTQIGGHRFTIGLDLSPAIGDLEARYDILQDIFENRDLSAAARFSYEALFNKGFVTVEGNAPEKQNWRAETFLELLMYELFLLLNLSAPGSCDLHTAYLVSNPARQNIYGSDIQHEFDLHGRGFEAAWYEDEKEPWLALEIFDVDEVAEWMQAVSPRGEMIPANPAAKCLFALLHLSKSEFGPPSLVWVFYALEALFDCKPGENFRALTERISELLDLKARDKKVLRKKLRELYDLRSAFVHGGLQVVHPLGDDAFDVRASDAMWRFVPTTDFGVALILKSLQLLIRRGWRYPQFIEHILPVEL